MLYNSSDAITSTYLFEQNIKTVKQIKRETTVKIDTKTDQDIKLLFIHFLKVLQPVHYKFPENIIFSTKFSNTGK